MTEIAKDENTGRWIVTTLKDKNGKTIMKSVSGMDIDRDYAKLVDMFMDSAIAMWAVDYKTRVEEDGSSRQPTRTRSSWKTSGTSTRRACT